MATDDIQRLVTGSAAAPAQFTIPGNGQMQPKSIFASYDGTAAVIPFIPALKITSDGGKLVGIYAATTQVAAGGSADVSWFPWRRLKASSPTPSPNPLGTVWAWYDFSDATTLTVDGASKIQTVRDKSGNGHDVAQGTPANRPGQTTINALNAGLFASSLGTNLFGGPFAPGLPEPYTVFVVNTLTAAAAPGYNPGSVGGSQLGSQILIQTDVNSRPFLQLNASTILTGAQPQPHTQYLFSAIVDGASSSMRVNGVSTGGVLDVSTLSTVGLGQAHIPNIPGDNSGLDGAIGEVLYYTTHLTATQLLAVEAYLKAKWGTP